LQELLKLFEARMILVELLLLGWLGLLRRGQWRGSWLGNPVCSA
jgi:hypothetical protein